jgi:ribosome-binding protein aMBF1 (putative translation factor)
MGIVQYRTRPIGKWYHTVRRGVNMKHMTRPSAIREARVAKGISQETLARRAGFDQPYLSSLELGRYEPTLRTLRRLALALDVPISALIDEGPSKAVGRG